MRRLLAGLASLLVAGSIAQASFIPPAGFQVTDLGITAPAFGVSASGRFATATFSGDATTVTLYDTYNPGRTVIGTATINGTGGSFPTDIAFLNDNTLFIGDNGGADTLHQVTFSGGTGTVASFANDTFEGIQSIAIRGNTMAISGTNVTGFEQGDYYLKTLNLSNNVLDGNVITNSGISTIDDGSGIGPGFVGGTAITSTGKGILLDSFGSAFLYDLLTGDRDNRQELALNTFSAYAVTIDGEDNAYITAGGELRLVQSIDAMNTVMTFGSFTGNVFASGIAFTGGLLQAYQGQYDGTLLVNYTEFGDDFSIIGGGIIAISALPEPAVLSLLALAPVTLLMRRRRVRCE